MTSADDNDSGPSIAALETRRMLLRRWRPSDLATFAAMNADPRVMEFFPGPLSTAESDAMAARIQQHFDDRGYGLWAVEIPQVTPFAGFIGLSTPRFTAHFTPCTEIGWRLAAEFWGQGFATEGARAVLEHAFRALGLTEVVSLTAVCNLRSRRVMERIGMTHTPADDFDHPLIPPGDRLSRHVLYRARHEAGTELPHGNT
jgi:RimJ/RimL family protein N-acetyltransferase